MDELLIDEKKYVSSKQAAKITGYAKDYIGQLCREGRVPARLVGRSWYVLETAIQDHRFGADIQPEEATKVVMPEKPVAMPTWESPRYEASSEELLPSINRLRATEGSLEENSEESKVSEHLEDTWRDWFDRVADTETIVPVTIKDEIKEEEKEMEEEKPTEEPVNVPVHAVYKEPPEELLPHNIRLEVQSPPSQPEPEEKRETQYEYQERRRGNRVMIRTIQVGSILLATITASVAVIGSGYLDKYIISNSQVRIIAGVSLYNK